MSFWTQSKFTCCCLIFGALLAPSLHPQAAPPSLNELLNKLEFRNIGPFRQGTWVSAIDVPESPQHDHLYTIYAAARSGGVWKTTNAGITWTNITDSVDMTAVGAVAVAPSNPNIVWAGGGDQANARSSISGKGMFKSTDAGSTWRFMGLGDSHHIARIVIHPTNPDVVYVAAMGHLFSKNEERGVFMTRDGGRNWKKVLYINDGVGAIDLVINRQSPNTLYAAMYDKDRKPWEIVESGPNSGVYRTDDGGEKWTLLDGGLPKGRIGRIGIDIYQRNPAILYALLENQNPRAGSDSAEVSPTSPLARGIIGNELYRTDNGGRTWRKVTEVNVAGGKAPYSFNQIKINPHNDNTVIVTSDDMFISRDGGKTWASDIFRASFGDFRCMWWDPMNEQRLILGSDGGVQVSFDGGRTSDQFPNMRLGEIYAVGVDMEDPYNIYGGLQDHDSWKGPVNGKTGVISIEDWVTVGPGDGMYNVIDPTNSRWVYNTRELNSMGRMDQKTGIRTNIAPRRPDGQPRLRYNWIAPIAMSPHNPQILYAGAQVLFRSLDKGNNWEEISPDLTTNDPSKTGKNVPFCTITSISESAITPGLIWIGTDDGKVWVTNNHGGKWSDLTQALVVAGAPAERWVSRVFASPHDPNVAFVAKNGFRNDDFAPYLYKTTDGGATWKAIHANLPEGPINVVFQDQKNQGLLFVGTDYGVFVSIDGADSWTRFKSNLPTTPVHDLLVHPRENDLVLGTYGRGFWVGDISPLQEANREMLDKRIHLFDIGPRTPYGFTTNGTNFHLKGNRYIRVPNEPDAMAINFWSRGPINGDATLTITNIAGDMVARLTSRVQPGLNRVYWDMRPTPASPSDSAGTGRARMMRLPVVPPGEYLISLEVAGETIKKIGRVRERFGIKPQVED